MSQDSMCRKATCADWLMTAKQQAADLCINGLRLCTEIDGEWRQSLVAPQPLQGS